MRPALRHDLSAGPVLLAAFGILVLTVMDSVAKGLSSHHPAIDIVAIRYVSGILWSSLAALWFRMPMPTMAMVNIHSLRAVFFGLTSFLFFYALGTLPIVESLVLTYLSPIFMAIFAAALLKEKTHAKTAIVIAVSLVGVIVTALGSRVGQNGIAGNWQGVAAALGSAATYALSMVLLRARSGSDPIASIVFLQNILTTLLVLPVAFVFGDPVAAISQDWPLAALVGLLGTIGQYVLSYAVRAAPAARIGTMEYSSIVWAAAIGFFAFGEVPSFSTLVGAALIVGASLFMLRPNRPSLSGPAMPTE